MTLRVCRKGVERMCRPGRYFGCVRNRKGPGQSRKLQKTKWNRWFWWICHNPIHGGCTMQALPSAEAVGAGGGADKAGQWDGMTEGYFKECIFMTRSSVTWHVCCFGAFEKPPDVSGISGISVSTKDIRMWKGRWSFLRRLSLSCPFCEAVSQSSSPVPGAMRNAPWRRWRGMWWCHCRPSCWQPSVDLDPADWSTGRWNASSLRWQADSDEFGRIWKISLKSGDIEGWSWGWWQFSRKWEAKEN